MHDSMQYDPIQGQGHEPFKVGYLAVFSSYLLHHLQTCVGLGSPLSAFAPPLSIQFLIFCSLLLFLFSFSHLLYLFSSIVRPIPFYQNSLTPFPGVRS